MSSDEEIKAPLIQKQSRASDSVEPENPSRIENSPIEQRASDCDIDLGSDCSGSAWPPDGVDFNRESVLQGTEVGVHAESRSVQREGAHADHHLCFWTVHD
ncbi:hypothetical protein FCV25MIE_30178 [Fagus crenata]